MIINIILTPLETKELRNLIKSEMEFLLKNPNYAEECDHSYEDLAELWVKVKKDIKNPKMYKFTARQTRTVDHLTYCECLAIEDNDDPRMYVLSNIEEKAWKHKRHWASGYMNPKDGLDLEQLSIYSDGMDFEKKLKKHWEEEN